jgi:hypothetical protein
MIDETVFIQIDKLREQKHLLGDLEVLDKKVDT